MDLTRSLSLDGDRFFELGKMIQRHLIPELFSRNFIRIAELGKTVQFIKMYFTKVSIFSYFKF